MEFRTDLALEKREILGEKEPEGVSSREFEKGTVKITKIQILNQMIFLT